MEQSSGGSANSSDFVRKLYKMLESPSDESVVRWGNEGDSFVVLENEKFTKHILPKHFKHSNFASFVRQLNKYDFHKVRHSNEDGGGSSYGPGAWEFKHPDFKMNNKDALDNIRRKAPAARKTTTPNDDVLVPTHQIDMLNSQLVATQTQVTALQDKNTELSMQNTTLVQEVVALKGFVFNHEQILQYLVNAIMGDYDARRRRQSRTIFPGSSGDITGHATMATAADQLQPILEDEAPPSPLLHASKLLSETNVDLLMNNRNLEHTNGLLTSPTPDLSNGRTSTSSAPPSAGSSGTLRFADLDGLVYPVGQTNGIDPMYGDHIHNIPYSLPANKAAEVTQIGGVPSSNARKQNLPDPGWLRSPQILLVEDDPMCRKIGQKFLSAFNCTITTAHDGIQAVEKVRGGLNFDLILMDIIMPNLDGVSACHLIRQSNEIPTVAMTSNIRSDDINLYYQHGMSDILPKPFTKEGLLQLLEKHLNHLKKHPNPTLDHIKDEDPHMQHHAHLQLHSPQKTHHSSSSTWTSSNSPQMPVTHQPTPSDASDHSQHYPLSSVSASLYAAATTPLLPPPPQQQQQAQMVNPNGITYVTPPGAGGAGPPQVVGQRRPLDLGDADLAGGGKRQQQTMFGLPGLQDMRSR